MINELLKWAVREETWQEPECVQHTASLHGITNLAAARTEGSTEGLQGG
jgi:hypothetical protein